MSARRLRRRLDEFYDQGRIDGLRHAARDPFHCIQADAKNARVFRMAYDAGHREGRRVAARLSASPLLGQPVPTSEPDRTEAWDVFRCPHDDCPLVVFEPCVPHTETIGDESETVGRHCWDVHRCVVGHPDAWTHEPGAFAPRRCPDAAPSLPERNPDLA